MARRLVKHINYTIGCFSLCGFDSDQLYPLLWQGTGFKVYALVSDGNFRRFYRIHKLGDGSNLLQDGAVYWMWCRFDKTSKIGFFVMFHI